ncbi:MAG: carboxymuconolactone decarboxylase family protein [Acidimicrobiia bacterium]|nr:carboxymuconolactone decarboxylase family protein [Acidimicrobiia bacterium]
MSTQAERRANGIDVMNTLTGGGGSAEAAASMERRHGDLGTFAVDHVLGNLWSRPQLSRRDRSMIVVTFLATIGASDELTTHVVGAVNHGLSRDEIREIVNQVAGYGGFPMAMHATRMVDKAFCRIDGVARLPDREPGPAVDDDDRHVAATDVLGTLFAGRTSSDPAEARAGVVDSLGGVGEMAFDWGFGELWARPELSRRDRSMVTVAILAILRCTDELAIHVPGALNHGCSREEIEEIMVQLTVYGGFPRAVEGMRGARAAFAKIDARAAKV